MLGLSHRQKKTHYLSSCTGLCWICCGQVETWLWVIRVQLYTHLSHLLFLPSHWKAMVQGCRTADRCFPWVTILSWHFYPSAKVGPLIVIHDLIVLVCTQELTSRLEVRTHTHTTETRVEMVRDEEEIARLQSIIKYYWLKNEVRLSNCCSLVYIHSICHSHNTGHSPRSTVSQQAVSANLLSFVFPRLAPNLCWTKCSACCKVQD